MKTADLQKGAILLYHGREAVGEGMGFGVPIAKYSDETIFSGSSIIQIQRQKDSVTIRKDFSMDLLTRDKFQSLQLENIWIRTIINYVCLLYQKHKRFAKSILLAKKLLSKFGATSVFIRTAPKGTVTATYEVRGKRIQVKLDFSNLDRNNLLKVFVLNEQSAKLFRKYSDAEGLNLLDDEIGVWNVAIARSAKIADKKDRIGFNLKNLEGAILRRGRELMEGSLDWIGLDYELTPDNDRFEYEIEIFG